MKGRNEEMISQTLREARKYEEASEKMIKKEERHWKPALLGAGYWVCQDLWELRRRRSTGSEAERRKPWLAVY